MFWETLAAIFLLLAALPLWISIALGWGFLKALYTLGVALVGALTASPVIWPDVAAAPLLAAIAGINAAWSIPSGIWTWAKFEHPWWATIIACGLVLFAGGSSKR